MRGVLYGGLALLALWLILLVTRAAVGALLWVVLIAGLIMLAVYAFQAAASQRRAT